MKEPKKSVRVDLPMELYEQLRDGAKETVRTVPGYIRYILRKYFEENDNGGEK